MIHDVQWSVNSLGIKIVFCADTYMYIHSVFLVFNFVLPSVDYSPLSNLQSQCSVFAYLMQF